MLKEITGKPSPIPVGRWPTWLVRFIPEGESRPWGWEFAYRDTSRNGTVAMPMPLCWIVAWSRKLMYDVLRLPMTRYDEKLAEAYVAGLNRTREINDAARTRSWNMGFQDGYDQGYYDGDWYRRGLMARLQGTEEEGADGTDSLES